MFTSSLEEDSACLKQLYKNKKKDPKEKTVVSVVTN